MTPARLAPHTPRRNRTWGSGGTGLLITDARVGALVLSEERRRLMARMFGVPHDATGLVTLIAIGLLAHAMREEAARALARAALPSLGDTTIAASVVREAGYRVAGESSREVQSFGVLLGMVAAATVSRPALRAASDGVKAASQRTRTAFDHRYGHLVRRARPASASTS